MHGITWIRGALVAALTTVTCLSVQPAAVASPGVESRVGHLTLRPSGFPIPGSSKPRRLASATVRQDLRAGRVRASVTLREVPSAGSASVLDVEFGRFEGATCKGAFALSTKTYGDLSAGFTRRGATVTLDKAVPEAGYEDWNCAFVTTIDVAGSTTYDVLGGALTDVVAKPKLKIKKVELLGKAAKKVRLVRNVWTTLEVTVANKGHAPAPSTKLTGSGRGVRVKAAKVGKVADGIQTVARVRVKLTGKKRTTLTLVATSGKVTARRKIVVRPVRAPKRPAAGKYRSKDRRITFRVKNGKVVRFRGKIQSRCGVWPTYTYPTNTWTFPKSSIPRSGIIDRVVRPKYRRLHLRMRISGKRATRGRFYYSGDGDYCSGSTFFTARRVGR